MTDTKKISLTVQHAYSNESGYAFFSPDDRGKLGISAGDYVKISGGKTALARAHFHPVVQSGKIVLTKDVRLKVVANFDSPVEIEKITPLYADKITIQPSEESVKIHDSEIFRDRLLGELVYKGYEIPSYYNTFVVTDVSPSEYAIVTSATQFIYKDRVHKEDEESDRPEVHYEDIGGLGRELSLVREMIEYPLRHPEVFEKLGIEPPKGVLLYGPPGTGKTLIAKAVATESQAKFYEISGPEIVSKYYGDSEEKLREIFKEAEKNSPAIIFIDEIDSIAPKRDESKGEMERRVVAQLLSLMDGMKSRGKVIVIAATNLPDSIDPALRRGGRFDREIEIGVPDKDGRKQILEIHSRNMPLSENVDIKKYADRTHGFVGADLSLVAKEAAMHALRREFPNMNPDETPSPEKLESLRVTAEDFESALKMVQPSAMREVFVEVPDIRWSHVGGLDSVKEELQQAVEWPIKYADVYKQFATKSPKGFLLFGPPGTGKTLLAKAVANESECNFISVKGPELMSKWVGESEKGVREIFRKARLASPSIIFFDEIDAVVPKRGSYEGSSHVTESVVSQFLTELDGLEELKNVIVIGATNRPDMIDPALMRPGRLEQHIFVPPPDAEGRKQILEVYLREVQELLAEDINIDSLVEKTDGFVGADIEALVREAKMTAIREFVKAMAGRDAAEISLAVSSVKIFNRHFDAALQRVRPSLDTAGRRDAERNSWQYRYNEDERKLLEKALMKVESAEYAGNELDSETKELASLLLCHQKDFSRIKEILNQ
ncbi:MAG: AAA family ATPase [Methanocorpusculum parvum]|nr:AAA family ATPase [Methanocorpusculum parvum]